MGLLHTHPRHPSRLAASGVDFIIIVPRYFPNITIWARAIWMPNCGIRAMNFGTITYPPFLGISL
jgi:uncharacterized RDD family membrane protein YckC